MFRFTIRELVLLTLVVATGVGWWVGAGRADEELNDFNAEVTRLRELSTRDDEQNGKGEKSNCKLPR